MQKLTQINQLSNRRVLLRKEAATSCSDCSSLLSTPNFLDFENRSRERDKIGSPERE